MLKKSKSSNPNTDTDRNTFDSTVLKQNHPQIQSQHHERRCINTLLKPPPHPFLTRDTTLHHHHHYHHHHHQSIHSKKSKWRVSHDYLFVFLVAQILMVSQSQYAVSGFVVPFGGATPSMHNVNHIRQQSRHRKQQQQKSQADDYENEQKTTTTVSMGEEEELESAPALLDSPRSLQSLGWQPHFSDQLLEHNITLSNNSKPLTPSSNINADSKNNHSMTSAARVTEILSEGIQVVGPQISTLLPPSSRRHHSSSTPLAVGDWVLIANSNNDNSATHHGNNNNNRYQYKLTHILKRKSIICRKAPGRSEHRKTQYIAANIDTAFVVTSCNQDFNVARLERYVAMAMEAHVQPVIVLTKRDLCQDDDDDGIDCDDDDDISLANSGSWLLNYYHQEASTIANGTIPILSLDARSPTEPTQILKPYLLPGHTVAFLGSSGVGKSTLLNSLLGRVVAQTAEIHLDSGQGRHTTSRRRIYLVQNEREGVVDCSVLDTPGLRELRLDTTEGDGVGGGGKGVEEVFGDLVEIAKDCRFNDCKHNGEPGCAFQNAMERGDDVDLDRLERWMKLLDEESQAERSRVVIKRRKEGGGRNKNRGKNQKDKQKNRKERKR